MYSITYFFTALSKICCTVRLSKICNTVHCQRYAIPVNCPRAIPEHCPKDKYCNAVHFGTKNCYILYTLHSIHYFYMKVLFIFFHVTSAAADTFLGVL